MSGHYTEADVRHAQATDGMLFRLAFDRQYMSHGGGTIDSTGVIHFMDVAYFESRIMSLLADIAEMKRMRHQGLIGDNEMLTSMQAIIDGRDSVLEVGLVGSTHFTRKFRGDQLLTPTSPPPENKGRDGGRV